MTGSTALGERLDPESLRRVMCRYFDEMQAVVERHEGTVEKFIGDAVMAVFGIPVLHEDDALRAVRAAAEMRDALAALNEELERDWGVGIAMRTGVNTGEVVAGDARSGGQRFATGDAVNVAARLEQAAPAGRDPARRDDVPARARRGRSRAGRAARAQGQGRTRCRRYRLLAVDAGRTGARAAPRLADGRARARAGGCWSRRSSVRSSERACQLFTVLGAAGVGKSRLVAEFLQGSATSATVVGGRCLPYGEGITFWPLLEVVRKLYGEELVSGITARSLGG